NVPAIAPLGESRCNTDVFRSLAQRLGFEAELFDVSDEQLARELLWKTATPDKVPPALRGITLKRLKHEGAIKLNACGAGGSPASAVISPASAVMSDLEQAGRLRHNAPFANGGFPTLSGKCELLCERLAKLGHDPLPTYIPPAESPASAPELAARFPL